MGKETVKYVVGTCILNHHYQLYLVSVYFGNFNSILALQNVLSFSCQQGIGACTLVIVLLTNSNRGACNSVTH